MKTHPYLVIPEEAFGSTRLAYKKNAAARVCETLDISMFCDPERGMTALQVEFLETLKSNRRAAMAFEKLPTPRKKAIATYFAQDKTGTSLQGNIAKLINFLNNQGAFLER